MTFDLSGLSEKELAALVAQARQRKAVLQKRPPVAKVRAYIQRYAVRHGYTIDDLFGAQAARGRPGRKASGTKRAANRKRTTKLPPKYRNPANPDETWTGRGSQPRWLAALTAQGKPLGKFLIKP